MAGRAVLAVLLSLAVLAPCYGQENPPDQEVPAPAAPARPEKKQAPKGTVSGTVYCADTNQPARLAHISLVPASKDATGRRYRGETDLEGRFIVANLPEGKYYIAGELLGYVNPLGQWFDLARKTKSEQEWKALEASVTTVYVTARQAATVALRLERGGEISGTILYDDGSPAVGVHIALKPKTKGPAASGTDYVQEVVEFSQFAERTTDDRGRFRILGIAPGEYTVNAELPSQSAENEQNVFVTMAQSSPMGNLTVYYGDTLRASKAKTIKIAGGETRADADITIPLSKLHTIRGRVVVKSTGESPPTAAVQVLYADTREVARVAMAVDGEFEIPYVAEDSYILQATASGEHLPAIELDDDSADGFVAAGGSFELVQDVKTSGAGEIGVLVHGDVSGVIIATPDPPGKQLNEPPQTTAAPSETEAAPVSPSTVPVTPQ